MTDTASARRATTPWQMTFSDWKEVLVRSWKEASDDNVGLIAAGVAFYAFLAMVPLLGAIVLSYGLVAEPTTVMSHMKQLTTVMPADAAKLVGEQLLNVAQTSGGKKGLGLLLALAIALFGARQGAGAIITALNIAYEEKEKRGFIKLNLLALAMTAAAVVVAILATVAIGALGHLETLFPELPGWGQVLGKIVSYAALAAAAAAGAASMYRWGPSRDAAKWTWLTPGSVLTAVLWLLLTLGFGVYVSKFGNYNATYGSLATVVVLLTWLYLSAYILLFGAELNSELEHQTTADTTVGADRPLGERGAWSADHVASGSEPAGGGDAGESGGIVEGRSGRAAGKAAWQPPKSGSGKGLLAASGLLGLWLGRKLGVRKGKRIGAKVAAKRAKKAGGKAN
ncbi:YihY/virulence factor BrkB family protein [Sphingomonas sp.]|uniref:YihY/virulence factor BrkB family protein n=1 Tax=Sphingomonas sp. TaxID=28214 RepID=UPI002D7FFD3F|nr:YihY/virulence factor BrkB family protein [Sphingomonas sp.]HEU0044967.1 YihY/virulence factor BrkB family protein [Sphingomonas sp.]